MNICMQEVERLADDYYKKYVSPKTSLMLADVIARQGVGFIYI